MEPITAAATDETPPLRAVTFRRASGARVKLAAPALGLLLAHRQFLPHATEAGGVLLGRYLRACDDVVVDDATAPMPGDRRARASFHRDARRHQDVIDALWHASGGTGQYLGEWHTHAEPDPTPSAIDLADWRRRLAHDQFDSDSLLFVIVGTARVRVWEGLRATQEIRELTP